MAITAPLHRLGRSSALALTLAVFSCSPADPGSGQGNGGSSNGTGGANGQGGSANGGASSNGGSSNATGGSASGGSSNGGSSNGGSSNGGSSNGGSSNGGSSNGGSSNGGSSNGGTSNGGSTSGGSSNGGSSNGGSSSGGAATGGVKATGGTSNGGSSTGGVASGGTPSSGGAASGGAASGGVTGSGGAAVACKSIASTSTRPQLTSAQAATYTVAAYFAKSGTTSSLKADAWDPTAGVNVSGLTPDITVAQDGSGAYTTIQAAINAAGTSARKILIKPGTYKETVSVPATAGALTLYGTGTDATAVTIVAGKSSAAAGGTAQSATLTARSANFTLVNLMVSNNFATPASGTDIQAVALYTTGDKTVLQNVRLHGFQDTLYVDSAAATTIARVYVKNSFVEGDTDYIFGRATAVFDHTEFHYLASRKGTGSGVHFAPSTHVDNPFGFLVIGSTFTAESGAPSSRISLGRSWDQSSTTPTPNGQTVIRESNMAAHINATAPWAAAATSGRAFSASGNRFSEYCNSGTGAGG
ncbi:MAG: pectinesterase family protein [Polyangiaceae bacterium]